MRNLKLFLAIVAGLLLASCSFSDMAEKLLPDDVEVQMENVIDAVVARDVDAIKALGSEKFRNLENLEEGFEAVFEFIIPGEALKTKLVNAKISKQSSLGAEAVTAYTAQYERIYADATNLYTIVLVKQGGNDCCVLHSVSLKSFKISPSSSTGFTFKGRSPMHFLVLVLAIFVPIFIIVTLVKCVRTKGLRRKWLWFIFILVGLYGITFNWDTGDLSLSLINRTENGVTLNFIDFKVLGAAVMKIGPYSPWVIEVAFPLGAILFWFKARKIRHETTAVFEDANNSKT